MNRNEAIELAARYALENMSLYVEQYPHMDKGYMVDSRQSLGKALAMPKDAEPVAHTDAEIQALIEHMDSDPLQSKNALITQREWQIIKYALTAKPKADAERDCKDCEGLLEDITELNKALNPEAYGIVDAERVALLERIDSRIDYWAEGLPSTSLTVDLLRDIRAYLQGGA